MSALSPDDARRMRGVLSRLLSDHDGERLAAVDALVKLCGKVGLSVCDLVPELDTSALSPPSSPKAARRAAYPGYGGKPTPVRPLRPHQRTAWLLLSSPYPWDEWQSRFLTDLKSLDAPLSARQEAKLRECLRLREAGRVPA